MFRYNQHGWRIDSFFWDHQFTVGDKSVSFVHIDTSNLFYGDEGEFSKPLMKPWFKKLGWTKDGVMASIEALL